MNEKQFYFISILSLVATVALALLGQYYESASLLFNVMLTLIGVIAGIVTSHYFAKQQERENLGKFASLAYKLSIDIYNGLKDTITAIEKAKSELDEAKIESELYAVRLEELSNKLRLIQRFSLTANNNWRDLLPSREREELIKRETTIALVPISPQRQVRITQQNTLLHIPPQEK